MKPKRCLVPAAHEVRIGYASLAVTHDESASGKFENRFRHRASVALHDLKRQYGLFV